MAYFPGLLSVVSRFVPINRGSRSLSFCSYTLHTPPRETPKSGVTTERPCQITNLFGPQAARAPTLWETVSILRLGIRDPPPATHAVSEGAGPLQLASTPPTLWRGRASHAVTRHGNGLPGVEARNTAWNLPETRHGMDTSSVAAEERPTQPER